MLLLIKMNNALKDSERPWHHPSTCTLLADLHVSHLQTKPGLVDIVMIVVLILSLSMFHQSLKEIRALFLT